MKELKIKEWLYDKIDRESSRFNCFIDFERDEKGFCKVENEFVTVYVIEELKESEKAIFVKLQTGDVVGSYKGWKAWLPKSAIAQ